MLFGHDALWAQKFFIWRKINRDIINDIIFENALFCIIDQTGNQLVKLTYASIYSVSTVKLLLPVDERRRLNKNK